MSALDWMLGAFIGLFALRGFFSGFRKALLQVGSYAGAALAAFALQQGFGDWLQNQLFFYQITSTFRRLVRPVLPGGLYEALEMDRYWVMISVFLLCLLIFSVLLHVLLPKAQSLREGLSGRLGGLLVGAGEAILILMIVCTLVDPLLQNLLSVRQKDELSKSVILRHIYAYNVVKDIFEKE